MILEVAGFAIFIVIVAIIIALVGAIIDILNDK